MYRRRLQEDPAQRVPDTEEHEDDSGHYQRHQAYHRAEAGPFLAFHGRDIFPPPESAYKAEARE